MKQLKTIIISSLLICLTGYLSNIFAQGFGVNTNTPRRMLDVFDNTAPQLRLTFTDNTVYSDFQLNTDGYLGISPTGNRVGIGLNDPERVLHVSDAGNDLLLLQSTTGGGGNTANLDFQTYAASPVYPTVRIQAYDDNWSSHMIFFTKTPGADVNGLVERMRLESDGDFVFNEQSNANDFRIESDGNANMFFVDGTNNRVGIGLSTPGSNLEIYQAGGGELLELSTNNSNITFRMGEGGMADYGFYWRYYGAGTGNYNELELWSENQTGADIQILDIEQDGHVVFMTNAAFGGTEFDPAVSLHVTGEIMLEPQTGASPAGSEGLLYSDTDDKNLYYYDGTSWVDLTAAGGGGGEWTDLGTIVHPGESTVDEIAIGGTTEAGADIFLGVDGAAVFNEQSNAVNFRVESNGDANMLFVDGTNNEVGMGTSSPYGLLHLYPDANGIVLNMSGGSNLDIYTRLGGDPAVDDWGFQWLYEGSGAGDANYLKLISENTTGTHFEIFRFGHTTGGVDIYGGYGDADGGLTITQNGTVQAEKPDESAGIEHNFVYGRNANDDDETGLFFEAGRYLITAGDVTNGYCLVPFDNTFADLDYVATVTMQTAADANTGGGSNATCYITGRQTTGIYVDSNGLTAGNYITYMVMGNLP